MTYEILSDATAPTGATGYADGYAYLYGDVIYQEAYGASTASTSLTNSGLLGVALSASATGPADAYAQAYDDADGIVQYATSTGGVGSTASVNLNNSGTLTFELLSDATAPTGATGYAEAYAEMEDLVLYQDADGGNAVSDALTNTGAITILASATANGPNEAYADAYFDDYVIDQRAEGVGGNISTASIGLTNSGTVLISAMGAATSTGPAGNAPPMARSTTAVSFNTRSTPLTTSATVTNSGAFTLQGVAIANAVGDAYAYAETDETLIDQEAESDAGDGSNANVSLTNSGSFVDLASATANSTGTASGGYDAYAKAYIAYDLYQLAAASGSASIALASIDNSGLIQVAATANATAVDSAAATAESYRGIYQEAESAHADEASFTNTGTLNFSASSSATGAFASATATVDYGVDQYAFGDGSPDGSATASFISSGTLESTAVAYAAGVTKASASAYAYGVTQEATGGLTNTVDFTNSGVFYVSANATAHATTAYASAEAGGWYGYSSASQTLDVAVSNSGSFTVAALATSSETADAQAYGLSASAGSLTGSITNAASGTINVSAIAKGTAGDATATGIEVESDENNSTITNSGVIHVYAEGPTAAIATGIKLTTLDDGFFIPGPGNLTTVVNDGGEIWAGVSTDGGNTTLHGVAIDTTGSPNPVAIDLEGSTRAGLHLRRHQYRRL